MQFKFSFKPIINILYIFQGIILPPCFCSTSEYKSLFKFLVFHLSSVVSSKPFHELPYATCLSEQIMFKQTIFIQLSCLLLWNRRYKKVKFQKYLTTCASMAHDPNDELKRIGLQISWYGNERYENNS